MGPSRPLTVDGAAIAEAIGDGPSPTLPARPRGSSSPAAAPPSSGRSPARPVRPPSCSSTAGCATGGMNWFQAFEALGDHFRVIAPDLRGHGQGIRSRRVFRLADCADDCAATLVELGTGPVIVVGYSMGGPVAQLLWRRHRDLVSGLVLCATSAGFLPEPRERLSYQSAMLTAVTAARAATLTRSMPALPGFGMRQREPAPAVGSPTRRAATTGARSWKPATRSAPTTPGAGSIRSTYRPRSCARPRTRPCRPTYSSRSPTPSPAPPSTGSTTVTSPAPRPTSGASSATRASSVADRIERTAAVG